MRYGFIQGNRNVNPQTTVAIFNSRRIRIPIDWLVRPKTKIYNYKNLKKNNSLTKTVLS